MAVTVDNVTTSAAVDVDNNPSYDLTSPFIISNVLLAIFTIYAVSVVYSQLTSPLRNIPGPFFARFTDLWRLLSVLGRRAEITQGQLHEKHGRAVRMGPNMVSVSDPNMVKHIYSRKNVLVKSELYAVNDLLVNGHRITNPFSTRDEMENVMQMRPVLKYFSMGHLLTMEPLLDQTITYLIQRLTEEFSDKSKVCEMANWLHWTAWDVIAEVTFSKRFGFLEKASDIESMCKINMGAMDYLAIIGQMPWLDHWLDKNPVKRIGPPYFVPIIEFAAKCIAARRDGSDGYDENSTPDFLAGYLQAQKEIPDLPAGDDFALNLLLGNLSAGSDTVSAELRSILYHLCKTPSAMSRLQKELDDANAVVPLSWAAAQKLPFLCACVEEGMRLFPGVSLTLERVVGDAGLTLTDDAHTVLPPGTIVGINPWVMHRDEAVYGAEPTQFRPERWLRSPNAKKSESQAEYEARVGYMRECSLVFGGGNRTCAGRNLGLLESHKIIGSLVRVFDIELVNPEKEWRTESSWFIKQADMDMRVKRRKGVVVY